MAGYPLYHVDAFSARVFGGNPAAVVALREWLPDATLLAIAAENSLSETAYIVRDGEDYAIRWFAPRVEVDLCGHATLAAAHVVMTRLEPGRRRVAFSTRKAGTLTVERTGDLYALDLPARPPRPVDPPAGLLPALGDDRVESVLAADRYVVVYAHEDAVRGLAPDMAALERLDRPVCVTAPGTATDIVCRYFAPARGVPEDPVTGAAHAVIVPYWADRLGKARLTSRQLSRRGGLLTCTLNGDRVSLAGQAALYLEGTIHV